MSDTLLIIDEDCGVDDALALLLALTISTAKLLAITTTFGNIDVDNVVQNTFAVLNVKDPQHRKHIPVFRGSEGPLKAIFHQDYYFGKDGLNGMGTKYRTAKMETPKESAESALVRLAEENEGKITLIVLGPLTNLAKAHLLNKNFSSKLKEVVILGGNIKASGNITASAEFNFHCDPEAAKLVLKEFKCPLILVPWETVKDTNIPKKNFESLLELQTHTSQFIKDIIKAGQLEDSKGYNLGDFYAVAAVVCPESVTSTEMMSIGVETQGTLTTGQCVVDNREDSIPDKEHFRCIRVVLSFDVKRIEFLFNKSLL